MKLTKPIVFFDLESTGKSTSEDRIVQLACIKLFPDGQRETKSMLINPCKPISPEATEVHGITDEMVADAPKFSQIAKGLLEFLRDCDLGGYNSDSFDLPMLIQEFHRCNIEFPSWELSLLDVLKYEKVLNPNKLADVYKRYTGLELEGAHDALNDIEATITVFEHQLNGCKETTPDMVDLLCQGDKLRYDFAGKMYIENDKVYWAFGKHMGKPVLNDIPYLNWVLSSDFPLQTKSKLKELLNKV